MLPRRMVMKGDEEGGNEGDGDDEKNGDGRDKPQQ